MKPGISAIERAFDLARSGKFSTLAEIKQAIKREGYAADQLQGPMLARQLRGILRSGTPNGSHAEAGPSDPASSI